MPELGNVNAVCLGLVTQTKHGYAGKVVYHPKMSLSVIFAHQMSKATTTVSTLAGTKEQSSSGDPLGQLSELALALQLASEPEYWKESLDFEQGAMA